MRRRITVAALASGMACSTVGVEPPPEPSPVVSVAAAPVPSSASPPVEPTAISEPEPEPELGPEPEPPVALRKPWAPEDERRILAIQPLVAEAAAAYGVDPYLINGLIWVESKFRPKAKNPSGARGLMQLMPTTAKALGRALERPAKIHDPAFNVHAGTYYLSRMLSRFDGDPTLALAAYARGPGRVRSWIANAEPLPTGVLRFIEKVQHARAVFVALGWPEPLDAEGPAQPDPAAPMAW